MAEHLTLSPAATSLLDMIERQMDVSLEIAHPWLDPIRRPSSGDAPHPLDDPEIAGEALKALRTGEVRLGDGPGLAYGIFPLRRVREVVGCVIVSKTAAKGGPGVE